MNVEESVRNREVETANGRGQLSPTAKDAALLEAASEGDLETARELIEAGANVNAVGERGGWVPIEAAASAGDLPMMKLLLAHGANADGNVAKEREYCPLVRVFACCLPAGFVPRGQCVAATAKLPGDRDEPSDRERNELALAMVTLLLDAGAAVDDRGATAIGAAAENASLAVFALVLERATILTGLPEAVVASIRRSPDANAPEGEAVAKMRLVLDRVSGDLTGPDLRAISRGLGSDGSIALFDLARAVEHREEVAKLGQMLLGRGANPRTATRDGATVLHLAVQSGQVELARLLIERGADPDAKTPRRDFTYKVKSGATPRKMASERGGEMATLFEATPKQGKPSARRATQQD